MFSTIHIQRVMIAIQKGGAEAPICSVGHVIIESHI